MMPFIRMALFQSFRVDLPARCTNSLGLMTCSSYCRGNTAEQSGWHLPPPVFPPDLSGAQHGLGKGCRMEAEPQAHSQSDTGLGL